MLKRQICYKSFQIELCSLPCITQLEILFLEKKEKLLLNFVKSSVKVDHKNNLEIFHIKPKLELLLYF